MTPAFSETMLLGCSGVGPVVPVREGNIGSLKNSMKCVMSWHPILSWVCAASSWKASICQGPPVANLPLHTLCWAHSPAAWIIQHPCTDVSPHWTLFSRRKMSCSARQTARAYLSVSSFWLSHRTSSPLFDNSHLAPLLCAVQMTKWGNGLWKIIINASGPLTRKERFLLCSWEEEDPFKPCTVIVLLSLHGCRCSCFRFTLYCVLCITVILHVVFFLWALQAFWSISYSTKSTSLIGKEINTTRDIRSA